MAAGRPLARAGRPLVLRSAGISAPGERCIAPRRWQCRGATLRRRFGGGGGECETGHAAGNGDEEGDTTDHGRNFVRNLRENVPQDMDHRSFSVGSNCHEIHGFSDSDNRNAIHLFQAE